MIDCRVAITLGVRSPRTLTEIESGNALGLAGPFPFVAALAVPTAANIADTANMADTANAANAVHNADTPKRASTLTGCQRRNTSVDCSGPGWLVSRWFGLGSVAGR